MAELLKIGEIEGPDGKPPNDEAVIYTNDNDDWREITVEGRDAPEFAAFIVKAVNNHDALVKALEGYERFITMMHEMVGENGYKSGIALAQERCRKELDRIDAAMTVVRSPVGSETERGK